MRRDTQARHTAVIKMEEWIHLDRMDVINVINPPFKPSNFKHRKKRNDGLCTIKTDIEGVALIKYTEVHQMQMLSSDAAPFQVVPEYL